MDIEIVNEMEEEKLREPNGKMKRVFQKFMDSGAKICKLVDLPKGKTVRRVYSSIYRRADYYKDIFPIKVKLKDGVIYLVRTDLS